MAFWINLYNTLVLDSVIQHQIQRSIADQWAGMTFLHQAAYIVGGQRMSCHDIEFGVLRANRGHPSLFLPQFRQTDLRRRWVLKSPDKRIHFALNCASRSCPPIRAYSAENLHEELEIATFNFVMNDSTINPQARIVIISSIFRWFASDFGGREGVIDFLLAHMPVSLARSWLQVNRRKLRLVYRPYDWLLNGVATI